MKYTRQATIAVLVAAVLSACSNPGASSGPADTGVKADGTDKVKAKTLTVWTGAATTKAVRDQYASFGKQFGVKMNIVEISADGFETQTQTRWNSGERPDVMEYHATSLFWAFNPAQNMIDLSKMPFVSKSGDLYKSGVGTLDGKVYAAQTSAPNMLGMYYNKDILAKYGLRPPQTYADLASICTTLKQKDPSVATIFESGGSKWPTQILGGILYMSSAQKQDWAGQVVAKKAAFDDPDGPFLEGLKEYKKLEDSGCFNKDATTATFEKSIEAVATGKAAMTAQLDLAVDGFAAAFGGDAEKAGQHIGFAGVAADGPTASWAPNFVGTYYAPKTGNADSESTALAFIQFATGSGYQSFVNEAGIPPVISTADSPQLSPLRKQLADAYTKDSSLAFNSNLVGFNSQFDGYMTAILSGEKSPEQIAATSQKAFEQGARVARLPGW